MSHIVSLFRFLIYPLQFLWISSIKSIQKMTKNYPYILTINKSISTSKINDENKKTSIITTANENVRRHSKKLMAKLQKITSQTSVNNELNLLEISTPTTSQNTTPTECTPQTSVEENQLKVTYIIDRRKNNDCLCLMCSRVSLKTPINPILIEILEKRSN